MKRLALLLPLLALAAGCASAPRKAAAPAVAARLVRFSAWSADGDSRLRTGTFAGNALKTLVVDAPTNACEATFAVEAGGDAVVTGFEQGSFELLSARAPDGLSLIHI